MGWEEKRKYKRIDVRLTVEYRSQNLWHMIEARDISVGGMFLVTDKIEPPQTKIEVMFEFGEEQKKLIPAEGIVRWCRPKPAKDETGEMQPAGIGIEFTKLPLAAKDFIDKRVKKIEEENKGA